MSTDSYIHAHVPGQPGAPLIFTFHGTGGEENQFVGLARDLVPGAGIVSPRGDVLEMGAARFFRRTGEGVYDMDDLARRTETMTQFVRAHVEAARPSAVYGLGYSNGANILASVQFADPALFDATVLMHPLIPFEPKIRGDLKDKRILITAGRRDPICPPDLTLRLEAYLRAAEAEVTVAWHEGGHEVRPSEIDAARALFEAAAKAQTTKRMEGQT
ncbi:alpha/beta hydrolase [Mesorhizobium xinjiangense]|uniref:alpha/beta hydrolase n=1 Tax=Mesorhizobium xinjiangense TaxID=2678685 RepID=UPI0012EE782A|nr:alpha/beta hydrolase [Mesorhizobium xinjiangense]